MDEERPQGGEGRDVGTDQADGCEGDDGEDQSGA
jgi:hypothetical protein